ncbi:hypothetical protein GCM10009737_30950 [Nocardioides lentus]|uniref:N-acetyltransferase domain-containing protein n=1 Tax=Nocardioides lentus TaxID=338077 RepID=A0ABP5AZN2_9ACTN
MVRSEPGIRVVDVDDEADLHAWWSTGHAAGLVDRPYDAWPPWELSRRALTQPRDDQRVVLLAARPGGREAGAALVVLPSLDRVDTARIEVWTRPGLRRRGVGAALLGAAEAVAAAAGRRLLDATTYVGTGEDERGDGARFARRHGWSVVEESDAKLLELDAAAPRWDPLTAEVREHLGDHRVLLAVDRVPDVHAAGFCALLSAFASLLPPSEREHGDASWDLGRLRAQEARRRRRHSRPARAPGPSARSGAQARVPPRSARPPRRRPGGVHPRGDGERDLQPLDERRQRAPRLPAARGRARPTAPDDPNARLIPVLI